MVHWTFQGQHLSAVTLKEILRHTPRKTRVWIDETYVDYVGAGESLERWATRTENVLVCKSMSKVYALSGVRSAYLCASPHQLEELRSITPPWAVGLLGQVAAVRALEDPVYYAERYAETRILRESLAVGLGQLGIKVVPGCANFLLGHLPDGAPSSAAVVAAGRQRGLFMRDASGMGGNLGGHALRIAVKDAATQARMLGILGEIRVGR